MTLLDAPVTIEDRRSRVLAFSGRQDEADSSRVETILARQVPERYLRIHEEDGVFRELYLSDGLVHVPAAKTEDADALPRVAVAVRAGDAFLGSVWAAVRRPLTPEREEAFLESAKLVALHMLGAALLAAGLGRIALAVLPHHAAHEARADGGSQPDAATRLP